MKQHFYSGREPNFQKIIITSAVIHVLFITLIAVPLKSRKREYKSYFVNIVTPAQLRKTAELKTGKSPTGTTKAKVVPRRRAKSKKGVALEPADRKIKEIQEIKRLNAISLLAKKKKQQELALSKAREAEEARATAIESIRKKMMADISVGPAVASDVVSAEAESYHALIFEEIQRQWIHSNFSARDLEAIISFRMDKNGKVISHKIERSSGNYLFDLSAVKAILKASPLPPHPVEREVEVRFHL